MDAGSVIPFNRDSWTGNELRYLDQVAATGQTAGNGQFGRACEELLEGVLGTRVLLTQSCTSALELAALLLEVGPEDEVVLPSFTFVSVANAFALRGARILFADIHPDTLTLDPAAVRPLLGERTRCVVAANYGGVSCDMDPLIAAAEEHDATVVEDAAHGPFARYRDRWAGTMGALGALSFHCTKNFSCGQGGALLLNRGELVEKALVARAHGTNRPDFEGGRVDAYHWVGLGSNHSLSEISAATLLAQLEAWPRIQERRREQWHRYRESLAEWAANRGVRLPYEADHLASSHHIFHLLLPRPQDRDSMLAHLHARGIGATFHYVPLHTSPMGLRMGGREGECPVAEDTSARLLRLPLFHELRPEQQLRVIDAVTEWTPVAGSAA